MIRVNLLRSTGLLASSGMMGGSGSGDVSAADQQKTALGKLAVILVFPLLLFAYEFSNTSALNDVLATANAELKQVEDKKRNFGDAAPKVEKYTKLKKKIDAQMAVIRELTKNRLREVKTLDAIQNLTLPQYWYESITIDDNNVKLSGYGAVDNLQPLFDNFMNSPFFSPPDIQNQTAKEVNGKMAYPFEISMRIGRDKP